MKQKFILLVEDNPDDELLILRSLKRNGVDAAVTVVRDGAEALEYIFGEGNYKDRDVRIMPTVVFLDLKLPKVDGLEVLSRIRADGRTKLLPVVVLTSSREESDIFKSYMMGANSYISKPVDFICFSDAVCKAGIYWLSLNEPV